MQRGGGVSICAHASIFIKFGMVYTFDVSTIEMPLFISIETFRSRESTLRYSNFFDDTCLIFCQFLTISLIEFHTI